MSTRKTGSSPPVSLYLSDARYTTSLSPRGDATKASQTGASGITCTTHASHENEPSSDPAVEPSSNFPHFKVTPSAYDAASERFRQVQVQVQHQPPPTHTAVTQPVQTAPVNTAAIKRSALKDEATRPAKQARVQTFDLPSSEANLPEWTPASAITPWWRWQAATQSGPSNPSINHAFAVVAQCNCPLDFSKRVKDFESGGFAGMLEILLAAGARPLRIAAGQLALSMLLHHCAIQSKLPDDCVDVMIRSLACLEKIPEGCELTSELLFGLLGLQENIKKAYLLFLHHAGRPD